MNKNNILTFSVFSELVQYERERSERTSHPFSTVSINLSKVRKSTNGTFSENVLDIISSSIRKNQDAAREFTEAGRKDLAAKEESERKLLYGYLPEQLTSQEVEQILREVISELSAESPRDMGRVMKTLMSRLTGSVDGKLVSEVVKRQLNA